MVWLFMWLGRDKTQCAVFCCCACLSNYADWRTNSKDYVWLVHPCIIPVVLFAVFPHDWHLQSSLLSLHMASSCQGDPHRATCTWWPSHMSWRSPEWRWPSVDISCPGLSGAMAVCPWEMGTIHCCLRRRKWNCHDRLFPSLQGCVYFGEKSQSIGCPDRELTVQFSKIGRV